MNAPPCSVTDCQRPAVTVYPFQDKLLEAPECDPLVCLEHDTALLDGAEHTLDEQGVLRL